MPRPIQLAGMVLALCVPVVSGAPAGGAPQRPGVLEQKLLLAERLLQRLPPAVRSVHWETLTGLRQRLAEGEQSALLAEVDVLLATLGRSYRERGQGKSDQEPVYKERYQTRLAEFEAFREALEEVAAEKVESARKVLDRDDLERRVAAARALAEQARYAEAHTILDGAYHKLVFALTRLRDKETVEYRLKFSNAEEEYLYERRRYQSQRMLIQVVMAERVRTSPTAEKMRSLMGEAEKKHQHAGELAKSGNMDAALVEEELAVEALASALRLAGFFF
ncbi:MAG: hypothetical protein KDH88_12125 [Chromatiales bacterium]|nr:hypothetical protein [Chromatiales bacterium]